MSEDPRDEYIAWLEDQYRHPEPIEWLPRPRPFWRRWLDALLSR